MTQTHFQNSASLQQQDRENSLLLALLGADALSSLCRNNQIPESDLNGQSPQTMRLQALENFKLLAPADQKKAIDTVYELVHRFSIGPILTEESRDILKDAEANYNLRSRQLAQEVLEILNGPTASL